MTNDIERMKSELSSSRVVIKLNPINRLNTVEIDGHDITNLVSGLEVVAEAGDMPSLTIDILVLDLDIEIDGKVFVRDVEIPDALTRQIYLSLHDKFSDNETK